jgi:hypothetical protein
MKKIYLAFMFTLFAGLSVLAQGDNGAIKIILQDNATKEKIPFANVVAYKDGVQVGVATTNMDGEAFIKPLSPGKYTVKGVYVGYQANKVEGVVVGEGKTAYVTIGLSNGEGVKLDEVVVTEYIVPLIDPDVKTGQTITREDYQNLATKDINSVAATTAGVYQSDEGKSLNVRGARSDATTYFVDGVKVFGTPGIPQQSIEQINVITGGVPANFGDLTSGVISITTRGPQSKYSGGVELVSSQLTDPYGFNLLGFSFGGPIYKKKDSTQRTVLGFFVSAQGNYINEPSPSAVPIYRIKDQKLQELKDQPLLPSRSGIGFVRASEFVTNDDFDTFKAKTNAAQRSISVNGKIDYAPTDNTNITLGGFYDYSNQNNASVVDQLLNYNNNIQLVNTTFRTNLSITQKFGNGKQNKEKTQSLISNAYFKFLVSYEQVDSKQQSGKFKDDFFRYGYIGNFERTFSDTNNAYRYNFAPTFTNISINNGQPVASYTYSGRAENSVKFTPGTDNPDPAAYTTYLVNNAPTNQQLSLDYIAGNNGLRNGDNPTAIYNLFNNFGATPTSYRNQTTTTFRIATSINADVKEHAIQAGLEFDQRTVGFYFLGASALWTKMRLITNSHTDQLDLTSTPIANEQFSGLIPYYYFNYRYDQSRQSQFSERLLDKLGLPRNYTGFVNTDGLDPSTFNLSMFSADDLLNGAQIVNYIGYTHDGKKSNKKININEFINQKDENGRNLFPVGSFSPIYASVYIMDKFDFKDIKFNVGLRVDRYDANQQVLKDNYAFHEIASVGDLGSLENLPAGFTDNIPSNIPKDAAVYVAQSPAGGKSPLAIKGYRVGDRWYSAQGAELSDPSLVQASEGRPIPLFKDVANYDKKLSAGAFANYVAAINVMPRIAFSFPISDVANFFAHYDILTQRPTGNNLSPLDYYYIDAGGANPLISNPSQKPFQTIDYELGFSQVLNERKNASLTITSFYKENRNMINQRSITGAYPKTYIMFDNIDFSTVKGLSATFDFRRTGGSKINLNYTLQFADGSGSNANSGANLATSGQPNLRILTPLDFDQRHGFVIGYDYRFGSKKEYKGPTFKTKKGKTVQFLEDIGFNLQFLLGSGTPYTRWAAPANSFGGGRSTILGQINGSSKPWNFRSNLRIDKNIPLTFGKEDSENKKSGNLNIYLQILNLFNTQNVLGVYNFTGAADDDGFLSSSQAQAALALTNSAIAYSNMYTIRVRNAANYSIPRQIRIGLLFTFY